MSLPLLLALCALAGPGARAGTGPADAAPATGAAPRVLVEGIAEAHYVPRRHEAIFTASPVVLTREDAKLTCKRLVALFDERQEISTATCTGDVRFVRGERTVTCVVAVFDNAGGKVSCEGTPDALVQITEPGSEAKGSRLVYDLATDEVKLFDATASISGGAIDERQKQYEARKKERK